MRGEERRRGTADAAGGSGGGEKITSARFYPWFYYRLLSGPEPFSVKENHPITDRCLSRIFQIARAKERVYRQEPRRVGEGTRSRNRRGRDGAERGTGGVRKTRRGAAGGCSIISIERPREEARRERERLAAFENGCERS